MARMAIVVGGGIGGLSTARALQQTGWTVALYEQAPQFRPVGAGIGIAPNAVKALRWLGLDAPLRTGGVRQDGMQIRLVSGRQIAHLPGAEIERRFGDPFVALHRAELHRILVDSLRGVTLHTGHRATHIVSGDDDASVTFETSTGQHIAKADLVVAADGVHSELRAAVFPDYAGPRYAGYTVWRGTVPADRATTIEVPPVLSETWGRAARYGIAVIGTTGQVYWFACESRPEGATLRHDLAEVARRFAQWHPPISQLMAATPPETLLRHDVYYLDTPLPSFVRGRVAFLGDAAHAVTPDIGQGACLAIEDAVVLAAALNHDDITGALFEYDRARRPRTQSLAKTSGKLAHLLQLNNPAAIRARDTITRALPTPLFTRFAAGAFSWTPPTPAPAPVPDAPPRTEDRP
jgi:2-polyprenyl-6-methoxyphenol hydroxylase-like FAD-dependent oxidoreductase